MRGVLEIVCTGGTALAYKCLGFALSRLLEPNLGSPIPTVRKPSCLGLERRSLHPSNHRPRRKPRPLRLSGSTPQPARPSAPDDGPWALSRIQSASRLGCERSAPEAARSGSKSGVYAETPQIQGRVWTLGKSLPMEPPKSTRTARRGFLAGLCHSMPAFRSD